MRSLSTFLGFLFVMTLVSMLHAAGRDDDRVTPGLVLTAGERSIPLPLMKTAVHGDLTGFVAEVTVTQTFVNPYDDVIEATYVFPLPERAAVNAMTMRLPGREVTAEIKLREEAERIYDEAVTAGQTAALLNQERPNIFTQKVGNIPPGEKVAVTLTYVDVLPYENGISSFVFPMVVGPRYIPGMPAGTYLEASGRIPDTTRVPDASRITPPAFDEGEAGAHRIDLTLDINPGKPIRSITSPSHTLQFERFGNRRATVSIAKGDKVPNKDFILEIDLRGEMPETQVLAHRQSGEDGYVTVAIQPPAAPAAEEIVPKDLFFVVDNSGSMSGAPLDAAKALVKEALKHMNPNDRFTIMRFSDAVSAFSALPLANTPSNVEKGVAFIDAMAGMGGTEMLSGIRRALEGDALSDRIRIVFFLTDGYIGNDDEILNAVRTENHARARLFSLGVGSSVNRYLLSAMARLGRGEMQVMGYDEDPIPFVKRFYRRVQNPVLTDITLEWDGVSISDVVPAVTPDLFDGQPLLIHARYETTGNGTLTVKGRLGKKAFRQKYDISFPGKADRPAIANIWARALIGDYEDEETSRPGSRRDDIATLALSHNLMSKYTSFVAVDKAVSRAQTEPLIPVAQRLPLPDGVSRNALGDLSRYEIPPGDPFISVWAPAGAVRVTAFFPFGLVKDLIYDAGRDKWRGRFLVPAGIPDGYYKIVIAVEMPDGEIFFRNEVYHLDSETQDFETNFDAVRVRAGKGMLMAVDAIEAADEVYVHSEALHIDRLSLEPVDGDRRVDFEKWIRIDESIAPGEYALGVVVRDAAGNRLEKTLYVTVY